MDAEAKGAILDVVLGAPPHHGGARRFISLCAGEMANLADDMVRSVCRDRRLTPAMQVSVEEELPGTLAACAGPLDLLRYLLPSSFVDIAQNCRVPDGRWHDWLQITWGLDTDFLTLLAAFDHVADINAFLELATAMPAVQQPAGVSTLRGSRLDCHIHAGAVPPPSLVWAAAMDFGLCDLLGPEYDGEPERLARLEARGRQEVGPLDLLLDNTRQCMIVARILLACLAHLVAGRPPDVASRTRARLKSASHARALARATIRCLRDHRSSDRLVRVLADLAARSYRDPTIDPAFSIPGRMWPESTHARDSLVSEREVLAKALYRSLTGFCVPWEQELLLMYVRCKNGYLTAASGRRDRTGLRFFREATLLGRAWRATSPTGSTPLGAPGLSPPAKPHRRGPRVPPAFTHHLALGTRQEYRLAGWPTRIEVRVPRARRWDLSSSLTWLSTAFEGRRWSIQLCMRRNELQHADVAAVENLTRFVDAAADLAGAMGIDVTGLDLVGPERPFSLPVWMGTIRKFTAYARAKFGSHLFVALHLGEDSRAAVEGLCNMWLAMRELDMGARDRFSHALDLLAPQRREDASEVIMDTIDVPPLADTLDQLIDEISSEEEQTRLNHLRLEFTGKFGVTKDGGKLILDKGTADQLAASVREVIARELVRRGIAIEVCPTSNWRIGPLDSPLNHPVAWWVENFKGIFLVGTDDPSVLPCSIAAEHYAARSGFSRA